MFGCLKKLYICPARWVWVLGMQVVCAVFIFNCQVNAATEAPAAHPRATALLQSYAGVWEGKVELRTLGGPVQGTVVAEQIYRWHPEDRTLKGFAVFEEPSGAVTYAHSTQWVDRDGNLHSTTLQNGSEEQHIGRIQGGVIVWMPADARESLNRQTREEVVVNAQTGARSLSTKGFERTQQRGKTVTLIVEGLLAEQIADAQ